MPILKRHSIIPPAWMPFLFFGVYCFSWLWLSACFHHNDLDLIAWISHFVPTDWNVFRAVRETNPLNAWVTTYPPLAYWSVGLWMRLGHSLFGLFNYSEWSALAQKIHWSNPPILGPAECVWLKLLAFPFHLAIAWFGARLLPGPRPEGLEPRLLAQPALLFISVLMGQIDVMAAAMTVLAVWALARGPGRGWVVLGFTALALGTLLKSYPVLLAASFSALFLLQPRWRKSLPAGVTAYLLVAAAGFLPVWGPDFRNGFFTTLRVGNILRIGVSGRPVSLEMILILLLLLGCILLAVPLPSKLSEKTRRNLRTIWDAWSSPEKFHRLFPLVPCVVLSLLMFDRFWMPQYVVWVSPWVYLLQSWYGESWKEGHPISAVFRGFPLFFSATFLLAVPPNFPKNVDSSMYTHWKLGPTLGTDLLPYGVPLFLLHTACYWILPVLVLGVILQKGRTEPFKESQPYTTSWAHLLLFLVWADLFMLWPILRP